MRFALLAALLSGCAASGLTIVNGAALTASSGALACDWWQTRRAASRGWLVEYAPGRWRGQHETNPVLGPRPDPGTVDAYFAAALSLSGLGWWALPRRYRMAVPIVVLAIQTAALTNNAQQTGLGVCGVGG